MRVGQVQLVVNPFERNIKTNTTDRRFVNQMNNVGPGRQRMTSEIRTVVLSAGDNCSIGIL